MAESPAPGTAADRPERPSTPRPVGWVGAGRMGQAMVERLLDAGVEVAVWNRTPARAFPLQGRGATLAGTPAAAAGSGVVFSMLLDDPALQRLWEAEDGVLASPSCRVWVDCSTVSPAAASRAARAATAAGVAFAHAPISGNPHTVRAGAAIFAVSGDSVAVDAALPYLHTIGRAVHRVGTGVEASVVKLCVNALLSVHIQALAEVLVLGQKAGVGRAELMTFVNDSALGSTMTRAKSAALVELDFAPTFTPEGQRKDVRLALDLGAGTETPMPVVSAAEVALSRLVASGLGRGRDYAALLLLAARDAGVALEPESLMS